MLFFLGEGKVGTGNQPEALTFHLVEYASQIPQDI